MPREERVPLDLVRAVVAQSPAWVSLQEARHDGLGVVRHIGWEKQWVSQDALIHDIHILVVEWW